VLLLLHITAVTIPLGATVPELFCTRFKVRRNATGSLGRGRLTRMSHYRFEDIRWVQSEIGISRKRLRFTSGPSRPSRIASTISGERSVS
jgi:hypothetical protein